MVRSQRSKRRAIVVRKTDGMGERRQSATFRDVPYGIYQFRLLAVHRSFGIIRQIDIKRFLNCGNVPLFQQDPGEVRAPGQIAPQRLNFLQRDVEPERV